MKLVVYDCVDVNCKGRHEEIYGDTEKQPEIIAGLCPICGRAVVKSIIGNHKNNVHRVNIFDRGGL